jgi:lipopolysaccharide/colanic/teichoic acid biosynthesis glycosyltransferase
MRLRLPSSRDFFRIRWSLFDSGWALLSPLIALYFRDAQILRDAQVLSYDGLLGTTVYCAISLIISLIAFSGFRIHAGMTRYFSVHDAVNITKAVVVAACMTYVAVFTLTRLDGIPRSTPIIHALVLLAGLIGVRIFTRLYEAKRTALVPRTDVATEHILMIGSNRLSLLYIKFIRAYSPGLHHIVAVLDDNPKMSGRAIDGVRVAGPINHLEPLVNEFAEHGVRISHVIVGGDPDIIADGALPEIERICEEHEIKLNFVPQLIGLQALQPAVQPQIVVVPNELAAELKEPAKLDVELSPYFALKRNLDLLATVTLLILLSPIWLLVGAVALWDVGSPIFFWQQRLGQGGRPFLLHKIRTLKPPFDWRGAKVPDAERLSSIGRLVRKCRFDEFPQLLNVLVGDMSLIGPRPLLPRDQPSDPAARLSVRPGITGWAQVNGGNSLCVEEKDALDEWYIRNASLRLDLRIIFMTLRYLFQGERRCETAIADAFAMRRRQCALEPFEILSMPLPAISPASIVERV